MTEAIKYRSAELNISTNPAMFYIRKIALVWVDV